MTSTAGSNLRVLSAEIRRLPLDGLIFAAKVSKRFVTDVGRAYAGPDGLKGKKRRGLKLGARDNIVEHSPGLAVVRVQGSPAAGWIWANQGTEPHAIRRRRRGPLRKMTVDHPGWRNPPGLWRVAAGKVATAVPDIFAEQVSRVVRG